MVSTYQSITTELLEDTFPEKIVKFSSKDKPWFTTKLRQLKRQRLREYTKHGKSEKYRKLVETFNIQVKEAATKYKEKMKIQVLEGQRGSVYPVIKKMGERPHESHNDVVQLPSHAALKYTPQQSVEAIADHFSSISQEYAPLEVASLPPTIIEFLSTPDQSLVPHLSVLATKKRINRAKKPMGTVPGDLPRKLVQKCSDLIAFPASKIFNAISKAAIYPTAWKTEHQVAIPKSHPPENEDDLWNIAKTPFLSKVYESFIADWLISYIRPYLDPNQCGLKGLSITHYLIKFLHFVHSSLDMKKPHAVLAACIDLSKAFNRVDHSLVIQDLFDMHTPPWLLRIVVSYLSLRTMTLTFGGALSTSRTLPAGTPQGAFLGGIIFMVKVNGILLRPPIPRNPMFDDVASENVEYVDDAAAATRINLKSYLVPDTSARPRPLNFRERSELVLPPENNPLQYIVKGAEQFVKENNMIINKKKTQVIMFTRTKTLDFPPELYFEDGSLIETVSEVKLLGVFVTEDLKWKKNTEYLVSKARQKIWILHRLVPLGLSLHELFDVYIKEIRSILEFAVPVWHSSLTSKQSSSIEAVQKLALKIILRQKYTSYHEACNYFNTKTLLERRKMICLRFATKNIASDHCLFTLPTPDERLRPRNIKVKEFRCNSVQFERSSLPYLASLINSERSI